ncbi:restriction endonuclease subunit S [Leptospira sp. WS92.C1]
MEWIGEIPEGWEVKRLKRVALINNSKRNYTQNQNLDAEVVFLPMEKVSENGEINQELRKRIKDVSTGFTYFDKGDIILAKITPCFENGKGAHLKNLETAFGFGSTEFHTIKALESLNSRFAFYQTKTNLFMKVGEGLMSGSAGQKRLPTNFVEDFPISLPPLSEQQAIADFLDRKTAQINSLIEKKRRLIELLQEERIAVINQAVTRGIDPSVKLKPSGVEWLGDIPEHWEVKKLKWVADLRSGESITSEDIRPEGEYPVYGGNGLRGYTFRYTHEGHFILIGRQGALCGNINYASNMFFASEHAVVVTLLKKIDLLWLGELLRTMNLNQYSLASAQPGLSVDRIKNLSIPMPPEKEMTEIKNFIQVKMVHLDSTISKIEKEIELLSEYRTALISEVVTGKVKVV